MNELERNFIKEQTAYYFSTGMDIAQARIKAEDRLAFLIETNGLKPEDNKATKGL